MSYRAEGRHGNGSASFSYTFERDTELTGGMTLTMWVSTSAGNDLDLFAVVRKFDATEREVFFCGYNGYPRDAVAKGWLRASHRRLDLQRSRPGRPWHTHTAAEPVEAGQIVRIEIEILPSSTFFETGSSLRLNVLGQDAANYPAFKHARSSNRGSHTIHSGGPFDSHLLVPFKLTT